MKEDVGFVGNDYTTAGQLFTAGYIIGQWPCALALSSGRVRARVFFPAMAACWGLLTLGLAFVNDVKAVFVIRFFQAIFEASTFAGSHYLLGSWYTAEELVRPPSSSPLAVRHERLPDP
jgi:ACS family pantothenate transporter-like MFS transporter